MESHRAHAGRRAAGQFQNVPTARRKIIFEAATDVTIAARDGANLYPGHFKDVAADVSPLHSKNEPAHAGCYEISAVSQPMRWALAITDKVIVVAGALGSTVASTA